MSESAPVPSPFARPPGPPSAARPASVWRPPRRAGLLHEARASPPHPPPISTTLCPAARRALPRCALLGCWASSSVFLALEYARCTAGPSGSGRRGRRRGRMVGDVSARLPRMVASRQVASASAKDFGLFLAGRGVGADQVVNSSIDPAPPRPPPCRPRPPPGPAWPRSAPPRPRSKSGHEGRPPAVADPQLPPPEAQGQSPDRTTFPHRLQTIHRLL